MVLDDYRLTPVTQNMLIRIAKLGMTRDGKLIRGAEQLAARLHRSPRQISRHLQAAYEAHLLEPSSAGYLDMRPRIAPWFQIAPSSQEGGPRRELWLTLNVSHQTGT